MALNGAILNNIYNHYLTAYAPKSTSRFDTHKKSELRSVYNSIVKINKESPLYKLKCNQKVPAFAVGIKEDARALRNVIASLGGLEEDKILDKKVAFSSNEDIASVSLIGEQAEGEDAASYEIEVQSLASGQVNIGTFLPDNTKSKLPPATYSFDINIHNVNYEFQYSIHEGDTHKDIMSRLVRLVNNADIGLEADIMSDHSGKSALRLRSSAGGIQDNSTSVFILSDDHTGKRSGSVSYFGIDYLARAASNAEYTVNGEAKVSYANHFTLADQYEVQLNGISSMEGDKTIIGLKTDVESFTENVNHLVQGYNDFLDNTAKYSDDFAGSQKLLGEMRGIANLYRNHLDVLGLKISKGGTIQIEGDELRRAAMLDDKKEDFVPLKEFANSLLSKTAQISLNPMNYVDKTLVSYKNPGKNFATPYITSAYSGMLFNYYC